MSIYIIFIVILAFVLDAVIGDPEKWPHPVKFIGKLIKIGENVLWIESQKNKTRYLLGALLSILTIIITVSSLTLFLVLSKYLANWLFYLVLLYFIYTGLCLHDLIKHTSRVDKSLKQNDLEMARYWLSFVVGRDTASLNEAEIKRALIETLAENFADGIVAPLFYLAFLGPIGMWGYKAINTLDSMIAYRNERYEYFGKFAAKIDDYANYLPARLSAYLIVIASFIKGFDYKNAYKVLKGDAKKHLSPNSGYPEAAMAGALNTYLGGFNTYGEKRVAKPVLGAHGGEPKENCVSEAQKIVKTASFLLLLPTCLILSYLAHLIRI